MKKKLTYSFNENRETMYEEEEEIDDEKSEEDEKINVK